MEPEVKGDQPPQESPPLEDRIADAFGDKPETAPEADSATDVADEAPPVPETFEFEEDGEKFVLPKKLEKNFLQQRDYTQKTQSLAEQRKLVELKDQQFRLANLELSFHQEIQPEVQNIGMLDAVIKQQIDWGSMTTDQVIRKKLEIDQLKEQRDELLQKVEAKRADWTNKQKAEWEKLKAQTLDAVKKRVPNWSEDTAKAVRAHAISDGYTEAELASINDPRHALTLWKAHQFDQLQAKAQPTVSGNAITKPSPTNPMSAQTKNMLNYRKAIAKTDPGSPERKKLVESKVASIFSR